MAKYSVVVVHPGDRVRSPATVGYFLFFGPKMQPRAGLGPCE